MSEVIINKVIANEADLNRDPLSGTPGAHALGTTAGATSGAVAGVVAGLAVGGPIGGLVGIAVGAVAGGLAGSSAAEAVNPTAEEVYWKETYIREPYYVQGKDFNYYAPAYRVGWEARIRHNGRSFEEMEPEMNAGYDVAKSSLDPSWQDMRPAAHAAWTRVDNYAKTTPYLK